MTETEKRTAVCQIARGWLGARQGDATHRAIIDIYNRRRPAGSYQMTYSDPWCAAFVSAVGMAAGLEGLLLPEVSCDRMIALYRTAGRWIEDDNYLPGTGDLIFYDWDDSGYGDNTGSSDHVGIVFDADERNITVIEGNKGAERVVGYRTIPRNGQYIRGFAVPDYAADSVGADAPGGPELSEPAADAPETPAEGKDKPETSCSPTLPVLREGDESEAVRNLQRLLIARGYYCGGALAYTGREIPDGEFGPATREAVEQVQSGAALPATGVVDARTWEAILTK